MKLFKNLNGTMSLGIAAVAVAATALALVALDPLSGSRAASGTQAEAPTLDGTVGVFKTARTGSDTLPSALEKAVLADTGGEADLADSRRAFVSSQGIGVYLVPSGGRVCLLASDLSLTPCYSVQAIAHGAPAASVPRR